MDATSEAALARMLERGQDEAELGALAEELLGRYTGKRSAAAEGAAVRLADIIRQRGTPEAHVPPEAERHTAEFVLITFFQEVSQWQDLLEELFPGEGLTDMALIWTLEMRTISIKRIQAAEAQAHELIQCSFEATDWLLLDASQEDFLWEYLHPTLTKYILGELTDREACMRELTSELVGLQMSLDVWLPLITRLFHTSPSDY